MDNAIYMRTQGMYIKIPVLSKNTIIAGDSGSGKTFIVDKISKAVNEKFIRTEIDSNIDFDNTIVIKNAAEAKLLNKKNTKNKLIILDRADMYLDRELVDFINNSKNTFIIMTRGLGVAKYIRTMINSYLKLESHVENGFITIIGTPKI